MERLGPLAPSAAREADTSTIQVMADEMALGTGKFAGTAKGEAATIVSELTHFVRVFEFTSLRIGTRILPVCVKLVNCEKKLKLVKFSCQSGKGRFESISNR